MELYPFTARLQGALSALPFAYTWATNSAPIRTMQSGSDRWGRTFYYRVLLIDYVLQRVAILPEDADMPREMKSAASFLPMSIRGGLLFVPLAVNGKVSRDFVFDTGASLFALAPDRALWEELTGRTGDERDIGAWLPVPGRAAV